jgi:hypothetical protein
MTERLLQYIWQQQYFNRGELATTSGERLEVFHPGILNKNQGPDFSDARIGIAGTTWAGTVELHLRTSGWNAHGHSEDPNFRNVILHVVWQHDDPRHPLPVLELDGRIPGTLLRRYAALELDHHFIPCEKMIAQVPSSILQSWQEQLVTERIRRKSGLILQDCEKANGNWADVYWWWLARNFGHSVNADAFDSMARTIPTGILDKHRGQLIQLEALLMGQAGILGGKYRDDYPKLLQKEHRFLRDKYLLPAQSVPVHLLRMRPANFPHIRLAQLARLVHNGAHTISTIIEPEQFTALSRIFDVRVNDYWLTHYLPDRESAYLDKKLGSLMFANLLINTITPFLYAYGGFHRKQENINKSMRWLREINGEPNVIISSFRSLGIKAHSAAESQSLVELKTQYCDARRCLECAVGNHLLQVKY